MERRRTSKFLAADMDTRRAAISLSECRVTWYFQADARNCFTAASANIADINDLALNATTRTASPAAEATVSEFTARYAPPCPRQARSALEAGRRPWGDTHPLSPKLAYQRRTSASMVAPWLRKSRASATASLQPLTPRGSVTAWHWIMLSMVGFPVRGYPYFKFREQKSKFQQFHLTVRAQLARDAVRRHPAKFGRGSYIF